MRVRTVRILHKTNHDSFSNTNFKICLEALNHVFFRYVCFSTSVGQSIREGAYGHFKVANSAECFQESQRREKQFAHFTAVFVTIRVKKMGC